MKKRFFVAALAATMTVSSVMTASAATVDSYTCVGWGSANSGAEVVTGDFDITYTFHNESLESADNWDNFVIEFNDGNNNWLTVRADAAGWGALAVEGSMVWAGQPADAAAWAVWENALDDTDVTVTAKRTGNKVDVSITFADYSMTCEVTLVDTVGDSLNVWLSGEACTVTNIVYADNTAAEENTTVDNGSGDTTDPEDEENTTVDNGSGDTTDPEDEENTTVDNGSGDTTDPEDEENTTVDNGSGDTTDPEDESTTAKTEEETTVAASTSVVVDKAEGETVEVSVADNAAFADVAKVNVYQIGANGEKILVGTFDVVDGKVQFTSKGAGTYVLEAVAGEEETTTAKAEETTTAKEATKTDGPDTGDSAPIAILAAIATLAGAGVVVSRKKRA